MRRYRVIAFDTAEARLDDPGWYRRQTRAFDVRVKTSMQAFTPGAIAQEVGPEDFLGAVANLCHSAGPGDRSAAHAERMVRLLLAGLRVPAT